jgi:2-phospho-L-lactate guanylyltransferase (CobY/MobA/RfbA family)
MVELWLTGDVMRTAVVVMSKIPKPGFTKTRLMVTLSGQECAEFHRACLVDTCRAIKKSRLPGYIYCAEQYEHPQSAQEISAEDDIGGLLRRNGAISRCGPSRVKIWGNAYTMPLRKF